MGRVTRTFPGSDKQVRVVEIKLANGNIYKTPVAKLCVLDVLDNVTSESLAKVVVEKCV